MIYKFRTMRVDAELDSGPVWASKDDSRATRVAIIDACERSSASHRASARRRRRSSPLLTRSCALRSRFRAASAAARRASSLAAVAFSDARHSAAFLAFAGAFANARDAETPAAFFGSTTSPKAAGPDGFPAASARPPGDRGDRPRAARTASAESAVPAGDVAPAAPSSTSPSRSSSRMGARTVGLSSPAIRAAAAGGILADWGADVVKIEPPGIGDPGRTFSRMLGGDLPFNPPFEMDNRSKRSIGLDLTTAEGRALGLELIERADVFLTNVRPAALARRPLGRW